VLVALIGFIAFFIVGGVIPELIGPGTIDVYGQVALLPGDFALHGADRCSGQGRYAEISEGKKIMIGGGGWAAAPSLSDGYFRRGRCEFPFRQGVPAGHGTYVFEARRVARWVVAEKDLSRPLELTIDQSSSE
jgi:hypothetical protein